MMLLQPTEMATTRAMSMRLINPPVCLGTVFIVFKRLYVRGQKERAESNEQINERIG